MIVHFPADTRARSRRRPGDRASVEALLASLKGRRRKLQDRLDLVGLAIDRLENQVATKRRLEVLSGDPA